MNILRIRAIEVDVVIIRMIEFVIKKNKIQLIVLLLHGPIQSRGVHSAFRRR